MLGFAPQPMAEGQPRGFVPLPASAAAPAAVPVAAAAPAAPLPSPQQPQPAAQQTQQAQQVQHEQPGGALSELQRSLLVVGDLLRLGGLGTSSIASTKLESGSGREPTLTQLLGMLVAQGGGAEAGVQQRLQQAQQQAQQAERQLMPPPPPQQPNPQQVQQQGQPPAAQQPQHRAVDLNALHQVMEERRAVAAQRGTYFEQVLPPTSQATPQLLSQQMQLPPLRRPQVGCVLHGMSCTYGHVAAP